MGSIDNWLTGPGAVGLALVILAFFGLAFLDKMPHTGCCGCACQRKPKATDYEGLALNTPAQTEATQIISKPKEAELVNREESSQIGAAVV